MFSLCGALCFVYFISLLPRLPRQLLVLSQRIVFGLPFALPHLLDPPEQLHLLRRILCHPIPLQRNLQFWLLVRVLFRLTPLRSMHCAMCFLLQWVVNSLHKLHQRILPAELYLFQRLSLWLFREYHYLLSMRCTLRHMLVFLNVSIVPEQLLSPRVQLCL